MACMFGISFMDQNLREKQGTEERKGEEKLANDAGSVKTKGLVYFSFTS